MAKLVEIQKAKPHYKDLENYYVGVQDTDSKTYLVINPTTSLEMFESAVDIAADFIEAHSDARPWGMYARQIGNELRARAEPEPSDTYQGVTYASNFDRR